MSAPPYSEINRNIWQIVWKPLDTWSNPLMLVPISRTFETLLINLAFRRGWVSGADPMQQVSLPFDSREEAVAFAVKNGWKYDEEEDPADITVEPGSQSYSDNFLSLRTQDILAKEGKKCLQAGGEFDNPHYGRSTFFPYLKFHGDGECKQHGY